MGVDINLFKENEENSNQKSVDRDKSTVNTSIRISPDNFSMENLSPLVHFGKKVSKISHWNYEWFK